MPGVQTRPLRPPGPALAGEGGAWALRVGGGWVGSQSSASAAGPQATSARNSGSAFQGTSRGHMPGRAHSRPRPRSHATGSPSWAGQAGPAPGGHAVQQGGSAAGVTTGGEGGRGAGCTSAGARSRAGQSPRPCSVRLPFPELGRPLQPLDTDSRHAGPAETSVRLPVVLGDGDSAHRPLHGLRGAPGAGQGAVQGGPRQDGRPSAQGCYAPGRSSAASFSCPPRARPSDTWGGLAVHDPRGFGGKLLPCLVWTAAPGPQGGPTAPGLVHGGAVPGSLVLPVWCLQRPGRGATAPGPSRLCPSQGPCPRWLVPGPRTSRRRRLMPFLEPRGAKGGVGWPPPCCVT